MFSGVFFKDSFSIGNSPANGLPEALTGGGLVVEPPLDVVVELVTLVVVELEERLVVPTLVVDLEVVDEDLVVVTRVVVVAAPGWH